ncbi:phytanoyl-CoA dioxygenase family protein [Novipirellula sp. SH528]|uniref:phytanoyl-CoA dioxygenase family protein n=1 Tax=Novipirellula sp. SH528 TaxID=3454466 RepID=UPI003FA16E8D
MIEFEHLIDEVAIVDLERRIDRVIEGDYASGMPPKYRTAEPISVSSKMCRVSYPSICDPDISSILKGSGIGRAAAGLIGCNGIQAWFIHALRKPPVTRSEENVGYIGWHQDGQYARNFMHGDFTTAFISLTDVDEDCGPVRYVNGSHRGKLLKRAEGSGFSHTGGLNVLRERLLPHIDCEWDERVHTPRRGTVTFHHSRLIHGSGPNFSEHPRKTLVLHLRSESNAFLHTDAVLPTHDGTYQISLIDPVACPVLFGSKSLLGCEEFF